MTFIGVGRFKSELITVFAMLRQADGRIIYAAPAVSPRTFESLGLLLTGLAIVKFVDRSST